MAVAAAVTKPERTLTDNPARSLSVAAAALALVSGHCVAQTQPGEGMVAVKYLDYLDSQPGADRVRVKARSVMAIVPVSQDWSFAATNTVDAISGASPAYHTAALSKLTDLRSAQDLSVTRFFTNGTVAAGVSFSREADYLSRASSLQMTHLSEDRNTTWNAGVSHTSDVVDPVNRAVKGERKRVNDFLVGWTRVLTRNDLVQVNLGKSYGQGYFSDPYKVFDNRPTTRNSTTLLGRWNHHLEETQSTVRWGYRWFGDNWGVRAHTATLEWVQPLPGAWTVSPSVRLYSQKKADFYIDADTTGSPFPPNPPDDALVFSQDQRLSSFGAVTLGFKVSRQLGSGWTADVKLERYAQRSRWYAGGDGSPGLAPFNARSVQVGLSKSF